MRFDTTKNWNLKIEDFPISKWFISNDRILYHYTSIDALFGGIIVKDNPKPNREICLWATNCLYMNDPKELDTGIQFAHEILDIPINDSVQSAKELAKDKTFIISFSSAVDCLPMWRMYGKNGHGLALGFDTATLKKTIYLTKCIYTHDSNKKKLKEEIAKWKDQPESCRKQSIIDNILSEILENSTNILGTYILFWLLGKNPAYEYEQEVRWLFPAEETIKYRLRENLIIPYVEQYLPKSALKEIWLGPTNNMERAFHSLRNYLDHMGFNHVEIKQSNVPYRD